VTRTEPRVTAGRPAGPLSTSTGPGRALVGVYGVFALSASARAGYQIATKLAEAPLAYALSALRSLSDPPMATYSMNIDGKAVECSGLAALVANSASTGLPGVRVASDVDVSDGLLDVIVIEGDTLPMLLGSAVDAAQGIQPRALSRWRGKEIRVTGVPVQRVIADGEDAGRTPVEVSVAAGAIRVLVPKAGPTLDSTRTD